MTTIQPLRAHDRPGPPARIRALRALLALALLSSFGCAGYMPAPPPKAHAPAPYRVGAPDTLTVTILPDPIITEEVTVRPDGMITVQLIGDVPAAGRTTDEIAADVEERISRFKRGPRATVKVDDAHSTGITVLGEIGRVNTLALAKQTRVAEALGEVGGPTPFAKHKAIRVIRHGGGETVVYLVNLSAIEAGDLSTNIVLAPGDIVYVPPTLWARFGYALNSLLFPFRPFLGLATGLAANAVSGF